jgi:hypothetical protein
VAAAYGFGSYCGLIFSPLMNVLPFLLIGIGVDGMFILQASMDLTDPEDPMEERMGSTLAHAGASVLVASLTNFAAFCISSNTTLPALHAFSLYAGFSCLFDLILQVRPLTGCDMRLGDVLNKSCSFCGCLSGQRTAVRVIYPPKCAARPARDWWGSSACQLCCSLCLGGRR